MQKHALKCFGVGDGWPCADRKHSSYLYRFDQTSILIDCGDSVSGSYRAAGFSPDLVDRIFISHLHSDHTAGFFMLLQGFWLERRRKMLPVTMPGDGVKTFKTMLQLGMVFNELLKFKLRFESLRAGHPVLTGAVRVTPYHTTHLERLREMFQSKYPQRFEAFCFLIEAGRLRIGHSADIGQASDLEPLLAKPLDLLVCELAHCSPQELFIYLKDRPIKRIVFMHLARPYWSNLGKIQRLARKMLPDTPVAFARDGEEFEI